MARGVFQVGGSFDACAPSHGIWCGASRELRAWGIKPKVTTHGAIANPWTAIQMVVAEAVIEKRALKKLIIRLKLINECWQLLRRIDAEYAGVQLMLFLYSSIYVHTYSRKYVQKYIHIYCSLVCTSI